MYGDARTGRDTSSRDFCVLSRLGAVLLRNGEIVAAEQEERFTRRKHDPSFPRNAIAYCLKEGDITLSELTGVVFYDKPFLKFERLLETYYVFPPGDLNPLLPPFPSG